MMRRFAVLTSFVVLATLALAADPARAEGDGSPIGHFDNVGLDGPGAETSPTELHAIGWAVDPDPDAAGGTNNAAVAVFVDGVLAAYTPAATQPREDVGIVYPYGPNHGFDIVVPWSGGAHEFCAAAINEEGTAGSDTLLGCISTTGDPFGHLDTSPFDTQSYPPSPGEIDSNGTVHFIGWAIDPDIGSGTPVAIFVDGVLAGYTPAAEVERSDLTAWYPRYGTGHGFDIPVTVPPGSPHTVCAAAINAADTDGNDVNIGCITADTSPAFVGNLDTVEQTDLGLRVTGWIADRWDPFAVLPVAVFVDGELVAYTPEAGNPRPDVDAATQFGPNHGYDLSFFVDVGDHELCITSSGGNGVQGVFGCVSVTTLGLQ